MTPAPLSSEVFPQLICCTKLVDDQTLYDVKFYPFPTADGDQVFAVTGGFHVIVCRAKLDADPPFEVLRWFRNDNTGHSLNSVVWTKDPITRQPLLCVAGEKPKQIHILDVEKAEPVRMLTGHGNSINDLAISPLSTSLLASASADYTVRLWNLEPEYEDQPCVALFAGEGHRQPILACHFHPNGRWLLTAGLDTAVCLWAVPSLEELKRDRSQEGHPAPKTMYYPHFRSTEIHANYVDCVSFYGDFILSRAAKDSSNKDPANELLLWSIDGFDSDGEPPAEPPIPSPGFYTRSSFPHEKGSRGFQRLLTFDIHNTYRFYLRFGLLDQPNMRPILCMGNELSEWMFWDLQKLEEGYDPTAEKRAPKPRGRKSKVTTATNAVNQSNLHRLGELRKEQSIGSSDGLSGSADRSSTSAPPERKFDVGDSFVALKAHHSVVGNTSLAKVGNKSRHFATCQVEWSPDGTWMVAVGDRGIMSIFHRDKSVV